MVKDQTPIEEEETPTLEGTEGEGTPKTTSETEELPVPEVDYKKKFSDSSREVQRLLSEDKLRKVRIEELEAKLAKADELSSEEKLHEKFPDWDMLSDSEKQLIKRQEKTEKELLKLKEEQAWKDDFGKAVDKFPKLSEREKEFKDFCYRFPKGIDAETLAKSFLFEEKEEPKEPRKGLEKPTGGTKGMPSGELSDEEVKRLRETNFEVYLKMVRNGKIKTTPRE